MFFRYLVLSLLSLIPLSAEAEITVTKKVLTIYDPFNGTSNPKAIPGAILEYSIFVKNDGSLTTDNNSIKIADQIPTNTKICVSNIGDCKAPYFVNGMTSSGLTLKLTEYSNTHISNDYSYTSPTTDADADGADASVTKFRANMNGAFQAKTGATAPNFQLKFRVVVM